MAHRLIRGDMVFEKSVVRVGATEPSLLGVHVMALGNSERVAALLYAPSFAYLSNPCCRR